MTVKPISFQVENNHLSGVIHFPNTIDKKAPAIVFVHGFVGSKVGEHRLFVKAARYFSERGFIVFRFDFSGCGESDGDYGSITVTNQIKELQSAIDYLSNIEEVDETNITVIGHSLGGAVSSLTAAIDQRIHDLILWSPVARPYKDITRITGLDAVGSALKNGVYDYHGFNLSYNFFQDLKQHEPLRAIQSYQGDCYIIHAEKDEDVPKENASDYYLALKQRDSYQNVKVQYINDSDHTFSGYSFENELFEASYHWLNREKTFNHKLPNII